MKSTILLVLILIQFRVNALSKEVSVFKQMEQLFHHSNAEISISDFGDFKPIFNFNSDWTSSLSSAPKFGNLGEYDYGNDSKEVYGGLRDLDSYNGLSCKIKVHKHFNGDIHKVSEVFPVSFMSSETVESLAEALKEPYGMDYAQLTRARPRIVFPKISKMDKDLHRGMFFSLNEPDTPFYEFEKPDKNLIKTSFLQSYHKNTNYEVISNDHVVYDIELYASKRTTFYFKKNEFYSRKADRSKKIITFKRVIENYADEAESEVAYGVCKEQKRYFCSLSRYGLPKDMRAYKNYLNAIYVGGDEAEARAKLKKGIAELYCSYDAYDENERYYKKDEAEVCIKKTESYIASLNSRQLICGPNLAELRPSMTYQKKNGKMLWSQSGEIINYNSSGNIEVMPVSAFRFGNWDKYRK